MLKSVAVFMYALFFSLALTIAYQHTLGVPSLSGLYGLYVMVIQPQLGLLIVYLTTVNKGK